MSIKNTVGVCNKQRGWGESDSALAVSEIAKEFRPHVCDTLHNPWYWPMSGDYERLGVVLGANYSTHNILWLLTVSGAFHLVKRP